MSEEQVVPVRHRRRSSAEIRQLVEEFVQSGLRQSEFCRRRGVVLNTLKRYLKQDRKAQRADAGCGALVAVEVAAAGPTPVRHPDSNLAVVLSSGHRIEVGVRFDAATLARLVTVLERL